MKYMAILRHIFTFISSLGIAEISSRVVRSILVSRSGQRTSLANSSVFASALGMSLPRVLPNKRLKLTPPRPLWYSFICERSHSAPQPRRIPLDCCPIGAFATIDPLRPACRSAVRVCPGHPVERTAVGLDRAPLFRPERGKHAGHHRFCLGRLC